LYTGDVLDYDDEESLILAMPKNSGGTVLSSTRAVWYGKVSARIKTSHLAGVVTGFILYSGAGDELDYEFVGADLETAQTNFYWESVLNYTNSANISTTDTFENYHTYELDWHEDYVTWSIDGVVGRTLYKNETYNATTQNINTHKPHPRWIFPFGQVVILPTLQEPLHGLVVKLIGTHPISATQDIIMLLSMKLISHVMIHQAIPRGMVLLLMCILRPVNFWPKTLLLPMMRS